MASTPDEIREFLASYPPPATELATSLRSLVRRLIPEATESLDLSARVIGFALAPGYSGLVCTIIPSKSGVKLGIVEGARLPDPHSLLSGTGKRHRHIQFRATSDLDRPGVEQLIKAAVAAARARSAR